MMEKAMRSLTGNPGHIVLKIIKQQNGPDFAKMVSACYSPGTPLNRRKDSTVLPLNQGIAYEAYITRGIAYCNDILTDPRFWPRERAAEYSVRYRTVVSCPVKMNKEVVAILCFDWLEPNQYNVDFN